MSLKKDALRKIQSLDGKIFTYNDAVEFCRVWGKKISNFERRMREVAEKEDSGIEVMRNKKNYIIGWRKKVEQSRLF